jgi:acetyl-CoA acetyltransferase
VPIFKSENACASGASAAHLAWLSVASGQVDVAIAVGAEKLFHWDNTRSFAAIEAGTDLSLSLQDAENPRGSVMMWPYGAEAREYAERSAETSPKRWPP